MPPVEGTEVIELFSSLCDVVPFLSPAKAIIDLIIAALEKVEDNTHQCSYLLHRCLNLYLHVHGDCCQGFITEETYSAALRQLRASLEKIHLCVVEISRKTPLQRLFQRHEISDTIQNAHRDLDGCLELFHVDAATSLIFVLEKHEAARVRDQAQLNTTLMQLLRNDVDILTNLDLRTDQIMEAIRGLQNTLKRGNTDSVQEKFAEESLQSLLREGHNAYVQPLCEWAVSSMEIFVEGEVLGSGAFGTVHCGRWNGSRVAVKKLARGTPRQVLVQEIEIWRKMQHPHIASFFRACIDSHPPLMLSELYGYGNVIQYISLFTECNRLRLCYQISLGMQFLHAHKVIHGDLKPANVLVDDSHRARITDFGLSRIKTSLTTQTSADANKPTVTRVPGTKAFMAPERLLRGKNNFKTDVYAWAMSAYQIFCDDAPFQHLPEEYLCSRVIDHGLRPDRPEEPEITQRGLTDEVWQLLEQCWTQDFRHRPEFHQISDSLLSFDNDRCLGTPHAYTSRTDSDQTLVSNTADVSLRTDNGLVANTEHLNSQVSFLDYYLGQQSPVSISDIQTPASPSSDTQIDTRKIGHLSVSPPDSRWSVNASEPNTGRSSAPSPTSQATLTGDLDGAKLYANAYANEDLKIKTKRSWTRRFSSKMKSRSSIASTELGSSKPEIRVEAHGQNSKRLSITVVGSGGCGKTSLLINFAMKAEPCGYNVTIEEHISADISIAGSRVLLDMTDTAGQEEYAILLDYSLQYADVAIITFSIASRYSLQDVSLRFIPHFKRVNKTAPMIIVGLKSDLRSGNKECVDQETAEAVAKQYGAPYLECSALTGEGVREVFEMATKVAMDAMARNGQPPTLTTQGGGTCSSPGGCIIS